MQCCSSECQCSSNYRMLERLKQDVKPQITTQTRCPTHARTHTPAQICKAGMEKENALMILVVSEWL